MQRLAIIISPNYKDYAAKYLADCLTSLQAQTHQEFDIFLIDNETSAESFALLQRLAPQAEIIRRPHNDGFAGGNNAALALVLERDYEWVFLLNMDTVVESTCLEKLLATAAQYPEAGAFQARLMLHPQQQLVNSLGNETHFLGFGYARGYQEPFHEADNEVRTIAYPSGAAVLLYVSALRHVGLFDEELWMYNEDQDLGWRLWLAGYPCMVAPEAVVYHKYEFSRSIQRYYWLDRNRILVILKNYHWLTLVLIVPAFIVMELGLVFFAWQAGYLKEKIKVWKYFTSLEKWRLLGGKRRVVQTKRITAERVMVPLITGRIWYQEIGSAKLRIANLFLGAYWKIVSFLIVW